MLEATERPNVLMDSLSPQSYKIFMKMLLFTLHLSQYFADDGLQLIDVEFMEEN